MTDIKAAAGDIENAFEASRYPEGFLKNYDQLECLAQNRGTETFLVKRKNDGKLFIAKCYDRSLYPFNRESEILQNLSHDALPVFADEYQNEEKTCVVREYIEGSPLNRYISEGRRSDKDLIRICTELCDILIYLHSRKDPVIHRDIKPQNIIVKEDGHIALIDFDIARVYSGGAETDTQILGTREYAPPEQYGFSQTDSRADIYSCGILLRYLLTGSERENTDIRISKPLARVIGKCTAFDPNRRFKSAHALKRALISSGSGIRTIQIAFAVLSLTAAAVICLFAAVKWYQNTVSDPFDGSTIPAVMTDQERVSDAVSYMKDKYKTDLFDDEASYADIGFVKTVLTDVYGYDSDYVHALPSEEGPPHESAKNFFPWGIGDEQYVARDVMVYTAVKIYWPDKVSDYSSLKDDNGDYPGVRVALAFAEETGIIMGVGRPEDITKGEAAILLANADRVFESEKE